MPSNKSLLEMTKEGQITIHGKNIVIAGDTDAKMSSPRTEITGENEAKIGCGKYNNSCYDQQKTAHSGIAINSTATGTHEIVGAVVKIN